MQQVVDIVLRTLSHPRWEFKWMQHGGNKPYQHACVLQVRQHHTAQISKPLLPKFTTPHFKNWKLPNIRKVLPVFFTYQQVWGCPTNYEHFKIVCIKLYKTRFQDRTMPKCWNVPNRFFSKDYGTVHDIFKSCINAQTANANIRRLLSMRNIYNFQTSSNRWRKQIQHPISILQQHTQVGDV